jgi:hypothetical protein
MLSESLAYSCTAKPIWCIRLVHEIARAFARAWLSAGSNMEARIAMMAMTTSNSISVKELLRLCPTQAGRAVLKTGFPRGRQGSTSRGHNHPRRHVRVAVTTRNNSASQEKITVVFISFLGLPHTMLRSGHGSLQGSVTHHCEHGPRCSRRDDRPVWLLLGQEADRRPISLPNQCRSDEAASHLMWRCCRLWSPARQGCQMVPFSIWKVPF